LLGVIVKGNYLFDVVALERNSSAILVGDIYTIYEYLLNYIG
jgi:hypothetical protein